MSKARAKRTLSTKDDNINHSQVLAESWQTKLSQVSPNVNNKLCQKEQRCISAKAPSNGSSFQASKVSSQRKSKQKTKKKPILALSEHQTPVLGKYFTSNNSNKQIGKIGVIKQNVQADVALHSLPSKTKQSNLTQNIPEYQQESTIKAPLSINEAINYSNAIKIMPPAEVEQNLDETIDKLRSKQQTIELLNKTIQTRLVDITSSKVSPQHYNSREDAYELEMNFYIDKITELQKDLYEKNRRLKSIQFKVDEFAILSRNNKKLIKENTRLRESLELSNRQTAALKKMLNKSQEKMY